MSPLLAGCGEAPVTPPLGVSLGGWLVSEGRTEPANAVIEELVAQAVLLARADGTTVLGVVVIDAITLPEEVLAALRGDAAELGLAPECWMIAATHSHSTPDLDPPAVGEEATRAAPWDPVVVDRVRAGVWAALTAAREDLALAEPWAGEATCDIGVNRRERGADGRMRGLPWLGRNPSGPVDRRVEVLRLRRTDRRDIVLASFGCHPAVLGTDSGISPDLFGPARREARRRLGGAFVLCAQGVSGEVNPVVHPGTRADCERLGVSLGAAIAHGAQLAGLAADPEDLRAQSAVVPLPARSTFPEGLPPMEQDWVDARRAALEGRTTLDVELALGVIGPVLAVGLPVELFCALGERIRALAAPRPVVFLTHCGGTLGYLPTAQAHDEGGYEALTTPFDPRAGDVLVEAVAALLADVVHPAQAVTVRPR